MADKDRQSSPSFCCLAAVNTMSCERWNWTISRAFLFFQLQIFTLFFLLHSSFQCFSWVSNLLGPQSGQNRGQSCRQKQQIWSICCCLDFKLSLFVLHGVLRLWLVLLLQRTWGHKVSSDFGSCVAFGMKWISVMILETFQCWNEEKVQ